MSTSNLWILCIFNLWNKLKQAIQTDSFAAKDAEILCQVKEVVQQSLSCHSTKMLKAIKHNDHCALTMKAFLWRLTKWHEILVELRNYTKPEKQIMTTLSKFTWIHMDSSLSRLENATKPFHRALKGSILRTCHELRRNLLPQMSQAFDVGMVEILGFFGGNMDRKWGNHEEKWVAKALHELSKWWYSYSPQRDNDEQPLLHKTNLESKGHIQKVA